MNRSIILLGVALTLGASSVLPAKTQKPQARPEAFEALVRCRTISEADARLQCFDAASATLEDATQRRELVVVDRKQIRETKKSLFGLDLPNLNIFGGGDDDAEPEIKSVDGVVASAYADGDGRWVVKLEDGSTWAQTDNSALALSPKKGQKIRINRAALGSYMMRVNNQPAVRAKRRL